jgi:type IV pilus assembly protein PilE
MWPRILAANTLELTFIDRGMVFRPAINWGNEMKQIKGFTLIELMIVVAIVAILLTIALPAYNDQIRKSRRAQAKTDLTEQSQILERMFTTDRDYSLATGSLCAGGGGPTVNSPLSGTAWYSIQAACTKNGTPYVAYTLTATPSGDQTKDLCGTLTINSVGAKTAVAGGPTNCW